MLYGSNSASGERRLYLSLLGCVPVAVVVVVVVVTCRRCLDLPRMWRRPDCPHHATPTLITVLAAQVTQPWKHLTPHTSAIIKQDLSLFQVSQQSVSSQSLVLLLLSSS